MFLRSFRYDPAVSHALADCTLLYATAVPRGEESERMLLRCHSAGSNGDILHRRPTDESRGWCGALQQCCGALQRLPAMPHDSVPRLRGPDAMVKTQGVHAQKPLAKVFRDCNGVMASSTIPSQVDGDMSPGRDAADAASSCEPTAATAMLPCGHASAGNLDWCDEDHPQARQAYPCLGGEQSARSRPVCAGRSCEQACPG